MPKSTPDAEMILGELYGELARLQTSSMRARLSVAEQANLAAIRQAYFAKVKQYHPHHFSRFGAEVEELASEVFLALKEAYEELLETASRAAGQESAEEPTKSLAARVKRQRRTSQPPSQSALQQVVRFKRPSQKSDLDGAPVRPLTAARTQRMPRSSRSSRLAALAKERTGSAKRATRAKIAKGGAQRPSASDPQKSQPVDHSSLVAQLASEQENNDEAYRSALKLLRGSRANEARLAFRELAVANPGEKRYRAYMHFAWGREHLLAGRFDEAAAEYHRALKVNPQFDLATEALAELEQAAPKGGMLGRFFKRGRS